MSYQIEIMTPGDWAQVRAIYCESLKLKFATFDTSAPTWETWDASYLPTCRLLAKKGGDLLGWAALSPSAST